MPHNVRAVEITLPEAAQLADLYGIAQDLEISERVCKSAIALEKRGSESDVIDAIVSSAIVRYCRCFKNGIRTHLKRSDLIALSDDDLQLHDMFEALRDKFIAHSVNPFEESYVAVSAAELDGVILPIKSVHPGHHRVLLCSYEADPLVDLISKVKLIVDDLIRHEEKKLLLFISSLPPDAIHKGDLHRAPQLQRSDVFKSRDQKHARNMRRTRHRRRN